MCFFLTVAVPGEAVGRIGEVFGRGFGVYPTANASVMAALPAGWAARVVTTEMCSCGLYARPGAEGSAEDRAHLSRKYARRGWSEAKIGRAMEQTEAKAARRPRREPGLRADVLEGLETLCRGAGGVAAVVHWYDGPVESERVALGEGVRCRCDELVELGRRLAEDRVLVAG